VMRPKLPTLAKVSSYLNEIDKSRIYSNSGPLVKRLEERYSKFLNLDPERIVSASNATIALTGCISLNVSQKWFIPEFTFAATGLAALWSRKNVLSVDVSIEDWRINLEAIGNIESGIVPVMPFGTPVKTAPFKEFESVVIDAAASLGAKGNDFSSLKENDAVVFSLHATKVLGCGEGAIVVGGSKEFTHRLRTYLNFGFDGSRISQVSGCNGKMSEVSAAFGLASLDEFHVEYDDWMERLDAINRLTVTRSYHTFISNLDGVRPYWIIELENSAQKKQVSDLLRSESIETRSWWPSLMSQTPGVSTKNFGGFENSKKLLETTLGLPLWRDLPISKIEQIVYLIDSCLPN